MYKLFLCLRYLWRRPIALVAIIGMALCVLMVVIVGCVMNGFLDLYENGARGMMGDVIVNAAGGMEEFDEFLDQTKMVPDVKAATPALYTVGLLRLGDNFTEMVRVAGLRLPEATEVTNFADQLYPKQLQAKPAFKHPPELAKILKAQNAGFEQMIKRYQPQRDRLERELFDLDETDPANKDRIETIESQLQQINSFIAQTQRRNLFRDDLPGIILGVDIPGTTVRDEATGLYTRYLDVGGADKALLTLLPLGRGSVNALTQPVKKTFNIVGDQRFGIYMVDSSHVYVDFDILAELIDSPNRCDQIQVKLIDGASAEQINTVADQLRIIWRDFAAKHEFEPTRVQILTWRQQQAQYIDAVEKQRDLMVIILGIISLVAVVLVFAIFYMMIVQKTRDIGIIKSIGASDAGIAQVFLMYGSAIGLIGSIIGSIGGVYFVKNINAIHDWLANQFGWRMFNRQVYLFDRIPDQVDYELVVIVAIGAIIAGLLGSLLPAIRAARMQPVKSLRYE